MFFLYLVSPGMLLRDRLELFSRCCVFLVFVFGGSRSGSHRTPSGSILQEGHRSMEQRIYRSERSWNGRRSSTMATFMSTGSTSRTHSRPHVRWNWKRQLRFACTPVLVNWWLISIHKRPQWGLQNTVSIILVYIESTWGLNKACLHPWRLTWNLKTTGL